jgi:Putative prokaryotic signal transducing protein
MTDDDVPVRVFSGPYAEVLFLQTLIESAGIATSVSDELRGGRGEFEPSLFVRHADVEHANELVADFRKNGHRSSY